MGTFLTPKQVARAIGVSDASLKRWCDQGRLEYVRTAGGHRRLPLSGVVQFLRMEGHALVRPEILGLPPTTGHGKTVSNRAAHQLRDALAAGDEQQFLRIIFDLYVAGQAVAELADNVIAPAFREVGEMWHHGQLEVYQERRGCEMCQRALHRLEAMIDPPADGAPLAIGGAPEGDPYTLPSLLTELTLRDAGWRTAGFGANVPIPSVAAALEQQKPRLIWLSLSTQPAGGSSFVEAFNGLYRLAEQRGVALVVGGRFLNDELRAQLRFTNYSQTLVHLTGFAKTLYSPPARQSAACGNRVTDGCKIDA